MTESDTKTGTQVRIFGLLVPLCGSKKVFLMGFWFDTQNNFTHFFILNQTKC